MSILKNIHEKVEELKTDKSGYAEELFQDQAIAALLGGLDSKEWATYMQNFAKTPDQLALLTGQGPLRNDPYIREVLAYLVGDAICTTQTLTSRLDEDLRI